MRDASHAAGSTFDAVRVGSLRDRILEYIAEQGGELTGDSTHSLQRQLCDALGERPSRISQALVGLEKSGRLQREMDLERRRCQAIRLSSSRLGPVPIRTSQPAGDHPRDASASRPPVSSGRQRAELRAAEGELNDLIRRAADASRRVAQLRSAVLRANDREEVRSR